MPPRVSDEDVKAIVDTTLATGVFISLAHLLVDELLIGKYSDAYLAEIERLLAAHYLRIRERREIRISSDGLSTEYERMSLGEGLAATEYGQQVLVLDHKGILRTATIQKQASIRVD